MSEPAAAYPARSAHAQPGAMAIVIGQLGQGGSERQLHMFLRDCDFGRWRPTVYVSGALGYWEEPIRRLGIEVVLLRGGQITKLRQFRAACRDRKVECFFSWSSYTNGYALALAGLDVWRIGSFRNAALADLPTRFRRLWRWMSTSALDVAVCNSLETCRQLGPLAPRLARIAYVPNAVDIPAAAQAGQWRRAWRTRLQIGDDAVLVVGVGRLAPQKNFARFIDAIAAATAPVPIRAVIAGEDFGELQRLQARAAQLKLEDRLSFLGRVEDARELISAADIYLLSSDHEGMPNVVLEAMAAGVAPVATSVNSLSELIVPGETGLLTGFDSAALAAAVGTLAGDGALRKRLGAAARKAIARQFGPGEAVAKLWALCERPGLAKAAAP